MADYSKYPTLARQDWPHEAKVGDLDTFFGNPRGEGGANADWVRENLVQIVPPWKMGVSHITIHKRCAESLGRVLSAVWDYVGRDQSKIDAAHLGEWGGSYNYRPNVNAPSKLSLHAYGAAIDMAPDENPNGKDWVDDGKMLPRWFIDAFLAEGWCWGGDFNVTKDPMHFQATFNAHADAPVAQAAPISIPQPSQPVQVPTTTAVDVLPPVIDSMERIKQFLLKETGILDEVAALKQGILEDIQKRVDAFGQPPAPKPLPTMPQLPVQVPTTTAVAPSSPPVVPMNIGITATMFGGSSDPNTSAYDNHTIDDQELGCALPYRFKGARPKVNVRGPKRSCVVDIVDVGPWNTNDPYWLTSSRPQAESGTDLRGRHTNGAGIDLTPAAARAVGIDGKGIVDWAFVQSLNSPATTEVSMTTQPTVQATVISPFQSKINWTQVVGIGATVATLLSGGKLNLDAATQLGIVTAIQMVTQVVTVLFRTFGTTSVTPQSLPPQ